jgi:glycosyltransferase involved in cell wall biosynthesis
LSQIDVIMPCYNAAPFVEQAVRSALGQGPEVELIGVDDGSTDGSAVILERLAAEFKGRMRILRSPRRGPYPARNLGLSYARGKYVAFLDADDYWAADCLRELHGALESDRADVAYCGWQNFGPSAPGTEPFIPPDYLTGDPVELFLESCPWPIHAALVQREAIEKVGGFSERMFSSMDYDFWLRILSVTRRFIRVPKVLAFYRWHGSGQISSVKWKQVLDAWQVRRDFVRANPELLRHLDECVLRNLVDRVLLESGMAAYWKRDLESAQKLFRKALRTGSWGFADLKYLLPSTLPGVVYRVLVATADRR